MGNNVEIYAGLESSGEVFFSTNRQSAIDKLGKNAETLIISRIELESLTDSTKTTLDQVKIRIEELLCEKHIEDSYDDEYYDCLNDVGCSNISI